MLVVDLTLSVTKVKNSFVSNIVHGKEDDSGIIQLLLIRGITTKRVFVTERVKSTTNITLYHISGNLRCRA